MADDAAAGALVPELARSLRTLGAPRDPFAEAAGAAVFGPLLEARNRASRGELRAVLAALRGSSLSFRIGALVATSAGQNGVDPAATRARVAQALELVEQLDHELARLDDAALVVVAAPSAEWETWIEQLRRVYAAADRACDALARHLARTAPAVPARWIGGRGGRA